MKIAYIYDAIYPYVKGGAEKRIWEISKRLAKRGHEVHLFGLKYWNGEALIIKDDVYLHGVCQPKELYIQGRRSISEAIYFARKLFLPLLKNDFDVIDCQQFPYLSSFPAKLYSLSRRARLIVTWYEVWGNYWYEYLGSTKGFIGKTIEKMVTKLPEKIIAISERIKQDLVSLGVNERKIEVVSNGVDFKGIQNIKPGSEGLDVIYVGRLAQHKNVDVLIRSIDILKKDLPNIKCGIIGDGPEREKLINLTAELHLEQNIKFFGFLPQDEDVTSLLKCSRVFVLPSIREGFPNTILEANACGLPAIIIQSKNNAGVSVIKEGENGFKGDLSEKFISTTILRLLIDKKLREYMAVRSIAYSKKHDWQQIVSKLEEVYEKVSHGT